MLATALPTRYNVIIIIYYISNNIIKAVKSRFLINKYTVVCVQNVYTNTLKIRIERAILINFIFYNIPRLCEVTSHIATGYLWKNA